MLWNKARRARDVTRVERLTPNHSVMTHDFAGPHPVSKIYRFGLARLEAFVPSMRTVGDNCSILLLCRKTQGVARVFGREFFDAETPGRGEARAYPRSSSGTCGNMWLRRSAGGCQKPGEPLCATASLRLCVKRGTHPRRALNQVSPNSGESGYTAPETAP